LVVVAAVAGLVVVAAVAGLAVVAAVAAGLAVVAVAGLAVVVVAGLAAVVAVVAFGVFAFFVPAAGVVCAKLNPVKASNRLTISTIFFIFRGCFLVK
jgi:hypothetical protein